MLSCSLLPLSASFFPIPFSFSPPQGVSSLPLHAYDGQFLQPTQTTQYLLK